jgi:glycerol uptake facilitator protein
VSDHQEPSKENGIVVRQPTLVERFLAEMLGTFLLVFIGAGAAALVGITEFRGKSVGLADLLLVALAHGFALFVIIQVIGKISGAHVNPAVTLGLAAVGRFPWSEVLAYVLGQAIGAIVGAAAILVVYGKDAATLGHLGAPSLAANTNLFQGLAIEALGAAILVLAIMGSAVDSRAPAGWAGLSIGLALAAAIILLGSASGAAVNPARALGPYAVDAILGVKVDWLQFIVTYLIGPIVGAVIATFLYVYLARPPRAKASVR